MSAKVFLLTVVILFNSIAWAAGRLLSATSSNDQDIFRLELQFDNIVEPNKVGVQFVDRTMILTVPESEIRKIFPLIENKSSFISEIKVIPSKDKTISIEIQFLEIQAAQMKENLAMEGLGKNLIIEVLPPLWNKAPSASPIITSASDPTTIKTQTTSTSSEKLRDEKEIPLFQKKEVPVTESSGMGKIAFMVLSVIGLGGALVWWMKNRSKMVNGPESLMKIKVVTQFHLGPKKTLAVVRVAGESLLLGITESQIGLIKTLSLLDEDIPEVSTESFMDTLADQNKPKSKKTANPEIESSNDEEFSFGPAVKTTLTQKIPMLRRLV